MRRFFSDAKDCPIRAGDFGYGNCQRMYIIVDGRTEGYPWSNIGENLHAMDLRVHTRLVRVAHDDDVHIRQGLVASVAHSFAERVQLAIGLPWPIREAATRLLPGSEPAYYANRLFPDNSRDPRLLAIFTEVIEEAYRENLEDITELRRVAHLAIFSTFLLE